MNTKEEFKLRLDPKSCPNCHGEGTYYSLHSTIFCDCPLGREMFKKTRPWTLRELADAYDN